MIGSVVITDEMKPEANCNWPLSPRMTSLPEPPVILSLPVPPIRMLFPAPPQIVSLPPKVVSVVATVLTLRHRSLHWPCAIAVALTAFGQIAAAYHWTSDALAGAALGIAVGTAVVTAWQRWTAR